MYMWRAVISTVMSYVQQRLLQNLKLKQKKGKYSWR